MIKRFRDHGNGGYIYEKRIYDRDILQCTCFSAKVDVPEKIVGLEKFSPKKRRDAEQQGRIVPNRSGPLEVYIEVTAIGHMTGNAIVDATIRTKNNDCLSLQRRRQHDLGETGIKRVIRIQKSEKRGFDMLQGSRPCGRNAAVGKM